jgi:hypothetical protein
MMTSTFSRCSRFQRGSEDVGFIQRRYYHGNNWGVAAPLWSNSAQASGAMAAHFWVLSHASRSSGRSTSFAPQALRKAHSYERLQACAGPRAFPIYVMEERRAQSFQTYQIINAVSSPLLMSRRSSRAVSRSLSVTPGQSVPMMRTRSLPFETLP